MVVAIGFVAALVISWAYEMTPEGIKKEADVDRSQSITTDTGRKMDRIIIGFLAVAVVLLLADRFMAKPTGDDSQPASPAISAAEPVPGLEDAIIDTPEKSIAVLPFTNMSEDASNEFFADGISEEILNALAKVRELKVAGRTSAFAFKGRNEDLREIGEALGVNHILEGSVRKAGNTVRVTAQLIQVSDGFHLWSETFDRELTDIFAIQDEIAGAILAAMKAELLEGQSITSDRVDPIQYGKYLLARQRIYTRNRLDLESAVDLLKEVTETEPGFAAAWAQRAIATLLLSGLGYETIPRAEASLLAKQYVDRALEIDSNQPEALAGMGLYYTHLQAGISTCENAIPYLERALELNPSLIDASNWLQGCYYRMGRAHDVQRILEGMFDRDPLYTTGTFNLILNFANMGQIDESYRVFKQVRPYIRDENWLMRAESLMLAIEGRFGQAYKNTLMFAQKDPDDQRTQRWLGVSMNALGMNEEVLAQKYTTYSPQKLSALLRLGRVEEGLRLAQDQSDRNGNPSLMIQYYHSTAQPGKLVDYIEARWPELEKFAAEFPPVVGAGHSNMYRLAFAYSQVRDDVKYQQALTLARAAQDRELDFITVFTQMAEASYWAIARDPEKALDHLQLALDKGRAFPLSDIDLLPEFQELKSEPRFRQLSLRAHEQFNEQRIIAGLEPIEPEWPQ
jgi:TolB-like protein/lipoprotein NlpI